MALAPVLLTAESVGGQSSFLKDVPPGKYEGIVVRFSGDAAAAQTFVIGDLGRVRLTEAGRDLVAADADNLRFLNCLYGGNSRVRNTAGAESSAALLIPRGFGDDNVHQIIEADVVQVAIQFGALFTTHFTGGDAAQIKIYGLVRETGEMAYNLLIHQIDQNFALGTFSVPLRHENVVAVYPVHNNNIQRVRVTKDGTEMVNIQSALAAGAGSENCDMIDISDLIRQTDVPDSATAFGALTGVTPGSSIAAFELAEGGNLSEALSDDVVVEYTMGAAQVQEMLVVSCDFTPTKLRQTRTEAASILQRKFARKNVLGRGRPVQTLRIAAE